MLPDDKNLTSPEESKKELEETSYTITEGNFLFYPFASLGSNSEERKRLISEVQYEEENETGVKKLKKWKVTGDVELGYPSWLDEKVFVAVIDIARRKSFPVKNPIKINISELCRRTELNPKSGKNRNLVRQALERIGRARIIAKDSFFFKEEEAHISDTFTYFQRVVLADAKSKDQKATQNMVWLSDKALTNINLGYIRIIDTKFFMKLSPIGGRLYEILSTRIFELQTALNKKKIPVDGKYIVEKYEDLCKRMPVKVHQHRSDALRQFQKAHDQLLNMRFLSKVEWDEDNRIKYFPGEKVIYNFKNALKEISRQIELPLTEKIPLRMEGAGAKNERLTLELAHRGIKSLETEEVLSEEQFKGLGLALKKRGVSPEQVIELINEFGTSSKNWMGQDYSVIDLYCEYYDWLKTTDGQPKPKSGAWLYKAISKGWEPPDDFRTKSMVEKEIEKSARIMDARKKHEEKQEEEKERKDYFDWLNKTPGERWKLNLFVFKLEFNKEYGRMPTYDDEQKARNNYLDNPETPEDYQMNNFGRVKYTHEVNDDKTG